MIPKLDSTLFDWSTWRNGTIEELLRIPQRSYHLIKNKDILREHAVGWTYGESLLCRPKVNSIAVMFFIDGREFWTHLVVREFNAIFQECIDNGT